MSDTPKTDAVEFSAIQNICDNPDAVYAVPAAFARELERENAELKAALALGQENCDAEYERLREERDEAIAESAVFRDDKARLDFMLSPFSIARFSAACVRANIQSVGEQWLHDARLAIDAARKEAQPCPHCTNGIVRSLGRDNDEVIEDCPHCSREQRKEAQP